MMKDNIHYYEQVLKSLSKPDLYTPAVQTIDQMAEYRTNSSILQTSAMVTAPVLFSYVLWILNESKRHGHKRLYFLARDGLVLWKIAQTICREWNIDIECRYFYCSRYTLRLPLYVLDREDALNKICSYGELVTPTVVLLRAGISVDQHESILNEVGVSPDDKLCQDQLQEIRGALKSSDQFHRLALPVSQRALNQIKAYFQQEGVGETPFAIVDSGWTGSMQQSFTTILKAMGKNQIALAGYYFGMFNTPPRGNGDYRCFFFSPSKNFRRSVCFNNNLFECMCSADHGMTIGYKKKQGRWFPVFKEFKSSWDIPLQIQTCQRYAEYFCQVNSKDINIGQLPHICYSLLKRFMTSPSVKETAEYGTICFSDDATENRMVFLAPRLTGKELIQQTFVMKCVQRIMGKKHSEQATPFWLLGCIAQIPNPVARLVLRSDAMILAIAQRTLMWYNSQRS